MGLKIDSIHDVLQHPNISNGGLRNENIEKFIAKGFWKSTIESLTFVANRIFFRTKIISMILENETTSAKNK